MKLCYLIEAFGLNLDLHVGVKRNNEQYNRTSGLFSKISGNFFACAIITIHVS